MFSRFFVLSFSVGEVQFGHPVIVWAAPATSFETNMSMAQPRTTSCKYTTYTLSTIYALAEPQNQPATRMDGAILYAATEIFPMRGLGWKITRQEQHDSSQQQSQGFFEDE
jgi:hypothetical protein